MLVVTASQGGLAGISRQRCGSACGGGSGVGGQRNLLCNRPAHLLLPDPGQKAATRVRRRPTRRPEPGGLVPSSGLKGASCRELSDPIAAIAAVYYRAAGRPTPAPRAAPTGTNSAEPLAGAGCSLQATIQRGKRSQNGGRSATPQQLALHARWARCRRCRHRYPAVAVSSSPAAASVVSGSRILMYQGGSRPFLAHARSTRYTRPSSIACTQNKATCSRLWGPAAGRCQTDHGISNHHSSLQVQGGTRPGPASYLDARGVRQRHGHSGPSHEAGHNAPQVPLVGQLVCRVTCAA